jgi:hypothetical protein
MKNELSGWCVASIMPPGPNLGGVLQTYQGWAPCIEWCKEQFGNSAMDGWRFVGEGVFEFREEQDYMLFLLRWS